MLLKQWAAKQGVSYWTALRWFKSGRLPVRAVQHAPGESILVLHEEPRPQPCLVIYGRVSSNDQREDLARQVERLRNFAAASGRIVAREVTEIGSGLNGRRDKLKHLLADPATDILVEHRDRLSRFGVEYIEAALSASGRRLIVANETEDKMDLVQDFVDVVTCMCARIYGKRSAKNRATKAVAAAHAG